MTQITKPDILAASAWFDRAVAATTYPNWVQEARIILRLRAKGYGYGKCANILTRIFRETPEYGPFNRQTIKNRYLWALRIWRSNL